MKPSLQRNRLSMPLGMTVLFLAMAIGHPAGAAEGENRQSQDEQRPAGQERKGGESDAASEGEESKSDQKDRASKEKQFQETLSQAVFKGRWCVVQDGEMGEEHEEKYTIRGVNPIDGDLWMIYARVQYGQKDVTVPVPVHVNWAGDTPVISITELGLPGMGTYTARVMIYENHYAGTWSAPDHGGLLHGVIEKDE